MKQNLLKAAQYQQDLETKIAHQAKEIDVLKRKLKESQRRSELYQENLQEAHATIRATVELALPEVAEFDCKKCSYELICQLSQNNLNVTECQSYRLKND